MAASTEYFLDICSDVCPMTFVRTKLLIERVPVGAIVEIRLRGEEPLTNVPRAVALAGHQVLSLDAEDPEAANHHAPHRLRIRKAGKV